MVGEVTMNTVDVNVIDGVVAVVDKIAEVVVAVAVVAVVVVVVVDGSSVESDQVMRDYWRDMAEN